MGTVSFQITYFDLCFFLNINFFSCFNNSFEIMMVFWKLLWAKKIENIWCFHIQNICCLSLLLLGRKFQIFFFYWEDGGNRWNLTRLLRPCTLLTLLEQFLFLLRLFVVDFIFYRSSGKKWGMCVYREEFWFMDHLVVIGNRKRIVVKACKKILLLPICYKFSGSC